MNEQIFWSIAGSDCTGGAGIQADIKTAHNLGAEACSVITAVTAQNAFGVKEINPMSDDVILSQITALEEDKSARVIKIGLLASQRQVELIADELNRIKSHWEQPPIVVYDPVAVASSGANLTEDDILPTVKEKLLPLVDLLTPNNTELQKLSGVYVFSWQCMEQAASKILDLGVGSVVIKGGHIEIEPDYCVDYCTDGFHHYWLASNRIDTEHSHGTGCTFSSAMAALLAQSYLLRDAFTLAKAYINQGLLKAQTYDGCYGPVWQGTWPNNPEVFPKVLVPGSDLAIKLDWHVDKSTSFAKGFASTQEHNLGLYPVVNSLDWCQRLLQLGVKTIQYREKILHGKSLDNAIAKAVQMGKEFDARLFINDHWELAIKHKAYGVHLGQEDLQDADLQRIQQSGLRLGISTHGHYEMLKAQQFGPSYLAVGAIFPTKTKDMTGQIQGLKTLSDLVGLNSDIPMVAIGGINLERAPLVAATGVGSIAVVTAITEARDPEYAVKAFMDIIQ